MNSVLNRLEFDPNNSNWIGALLSDDIQEILLSGNSGTMTESAKHLELLLLLLLSVP